MALLVAAPPLTASWLAPGGQSAEYQADVIGLFIYPVVLAAALHVYFHWRLTDDAATARLVIVLFAVAGSGLARVALRLEYAGELASHAPQRLLVDALLAVTLLLVLRVRLGSAPPADPAGLGLAIGLLFGALRLAALTDPRSLDPGPVAIVLLHLFLLTLNLMVAGAVLNLRPLPGWVRLRLAAALILLRVNHLIIYPYGGEDWIAGIAIAADLVGATLLTSATMALVRRSTRRRRQEIDDLRERIDEAELDHQGDRERLHEISATVAGLASARRLMHDHDLPPGHRRHQLEEMVESEIGRLERLLQPQARPASDVDLDLAIRPVVVAHYARGLETRWSPSGIRAHGRADDIAETVHILLDNAGRHAEGAAVSITGTRVDDAVEIRVQDAGPGIPPPMEHRIFLRGERGLDSSGEGIGLYLADRLMDGMGGSIRLAPSTHGTTFVLRLPKARVDDVPPTPAA